MDDGPADSSSPAAELASYGESEQLFVRRIAPLMREKCLGCHGADPELLEGSLDMRSLAGLTHGGDSGEPSLVPGDAAGSAIFQAAERGEDLYSAMPPKESEALTDQELDWLRRWIDTGADWPDDDRVDAITAAYRATWSVEDGIPVATSGGLSDDWTNRLYDPESLWAYQPVRRPDVPSGSTTAVDALVEMRLPDGLAVAPRAGRRDLIRRVTLNLTGLPPTPGEVDAFLADPADDRDALATVVDRLLASPHYGERMAQHWLDVVRYADSSGFANDYERGAAWRYRDYVVRAFNSDKPFDRFIIEQIAGDELVDDQDGEDGQPSAEGIVATGFLRMGPWELTAMEVPRVARQRFLDDVTNSVGETFLGHALQCARCHDHKFDPIPTQDYYALQAVFATTQLAERQADFTPDENTAGFDERDWLIQQQQHYQQTLADLNQVLFDRAPGWYASEGKSPDEWNAAAAEVQKEHTDWLFNHTRQLLRDRGVAKDQIPPSDIGFGAEEFGRNTVAFKGLQRINWELDRYESHALAVYNGYTPTANKVTSPVRVPKNPTDPKTTTREQEVIRSAGDPFAAGPEVRPGVLSVVADQIAAEVPTDLSGRRLALARWIADESNPLTTRVIANRIWQWHFGTALAGNPNNFGATGARPTHPELLDYLASALVEDGWSIKSLHRRILLSDAYARSTEHPQPQTLAELDPLGQSWAAFRPRRLTAEEFRDGMLAASGELNPEVGGLPARPVINPEVAHQPRMVMGSIAAAWVPHPDPGRRNRRTLYVRKLRGLGNPLLEVFNSPAPDFSCECRDASTVTPQAFSLFNSRITATRALALADRVMRSSDDRATAITEAFRLTLAREPSEDELRDVLAHWHHVEQSLPEQATPTPPPPLKLVRQAMEEKTGEPYTFEEPLLSNAEFVPDLRPEDVDRATRALADICLVLFNSNEFAFVY